MTMHKLQTPPDLDPATKTGIIVTDVRPALLKKKRNTLEGEELRLARLYNLASKHLYKNKDVFFVRILSSGEIEVAVLDSSARVDLYKAALVKNLNVQSAIGSLVQLTAGKLLDSPYAGIAVGLDLNSDGNKRITQVHDYNKTNKIRTAAR